MTEQLSFKITDASLKIRNFPKDIISLFNSGLEFRFINPHTQADSIEEILFGCLSFFFWKVFIFIFKYSLTSLQAFLGILDFTYFKFEFS